jgi:hypothetical protein
MRINGATDAETEFLLGRRVEFLAMLKLKPTDLPSKPTDDFEVIDENRTVVGRIMLTRAASRNTP